MAAGYAAGRLLASSRPRVPLPMSFTQVLVALPVLVFLVLLTHEAGHLIAAMCSGFRFHLLTVGPFTLARENGRIRFHWNLDPGRAGGLAAALPVPGVDLRRGVLWMVIGGPAASFCLGAAGLLVFAATSGIPAALALIAGCLSLAISVTTSIPSALGPYLSDGARYLMLRRGGRDAERWLAIALTSASDQAGQRPREWLLDGVREEWVDGSPDGIAIGSILYCYELDCGRAAEAGRWLDRLLAQVDDAPPQLSSALKIEAAWYEALRRGRASVGRAWLEQVKPSKDLPPWSILRAEAAVLEAEGRTAEAEARRALALGHLAKAPASGATEFERDLISGEVPKGHTLR
jgi:hypothetical protein